MLQVRGVAVEQLSARKRVLGQKPVGTAVDLLDGVVARETRQCPRVEVDADVVQRRRLALHDRPAAEVSLDIGVVRRHQGDDRLAQAGGRLRAKVAAHLG